MDRSLYTAVDFASDESYLRFYYKTDPADIAFWEDWISHHPEKLDVIVAADQLIAVLSLHLPEEAFQKETERLMQAIAGNRPPFIAEEQGLPLAAVPDRPKRRRRLLILVPALLLTGLFIVRYCLPAGSGSGAGTAVVRNGWLTRTNSSDRPMEIILEDSTLVRLGPGAALSMPAGFQKDKREVNLTGNAFFHVSRNPARPFYIFSGQIVTHVIGTSFTISQDAAGHKMEVVVLTGKVEVYEQASGAVPDKHSGAQTNGVILTPNQRVVYQVEQRRFETSLAENPLPLTELKPQEPAANHPPVSIDSVYSGIRISELLSNLSGRYGISIAVENENIYNCHFTGDLSGMGLYEKLDVVCKAVGATYELKGTQIMIRGRGCAVQAP